MIEKKSRKIVILILPFLSLILIGISVYGNRQSSLDSTTSADGPEEIENESIVGVPRVISVDPRVAKEGEEFTYYLRVVGSDTPRENLIMSVNEVPDWVSADPSKFLLSGTPVYSVQDTQKFSLTISDGSHSIEHTFYLLIQPADE